MTKGLVERGGGQLRGSNQSGMRAYNERLVLSLVRRHGVLVKTQIAAMTGLSAQTVSVIMRALEAENLLMRGEPIRGKVGQPSVPLSINSDGAYFLGLKVGRRSSDLVLIDFLGSVCGTLHRSYAYPDPADVVAFVDEGLKSLIGSLDEPLRKRIAGLGIAMPSRMWNWHEEVGAPGDVMDQWRQTDLRAEIAAVCDYPVYRQNDGTAACAAELIFGNRSVRHYFIYFYVGTFIGGGIVLNGSVFAGRTGNAGAIGSMLVPGSDGGTEQLIDQASLIVLERMLTAASIDPSLLWRMPEDWGAIERHVERWLDIVSRALAHAIVASISIIDFENVVIDGGMPPTIRARLVEATKRAILELDLQGLDVPEIDAGNIGPIARALGAASLPLFDKYLIDQNMLMRKP